MQIVKSILLSQLQQIDVCSGLQPWMLESLKGLESTDNTVACILANVIAPSNVQIWLLILMLLSEKQLWVSGEGWLSASTGARV